MHQIHDDGQAQFVGAADQLFQLLGRAEARGGSEETRHMVAERPVIGMLGDGHQLHGIITVGFDDGQNLFGELAVGAHPLALLRHADMGLVDQQIAVLRGIERIALPVERLGGRPELRRIIFGLLVLHHAPGIGRDPIPPPVVAVDMELVERSVRQAVTVHGRRKKGAPHPCDIAVHADFGALPIVEIAEDIDIVRPGQPLAQPPPVEQPVPLPTEVTVAVGVVGERTCRAADVVDLLPITLPAAVHLFFDGVQPCVALDDGQAGCVFFHRKRGVYTNIRINEG